jgi:dihydrofolate reductase
MDMDPFAADNFSKYRIKVIPNKECIIITHNSQKMYISNQIWFIFSSVLNILQNTAEDESDLIRNI